MLAAKQLVDVIVTRSVV